MTSVHAVLVCCAHRQCHLWFKVFLAFLPGRTYHSVTFSTQSLQGNCCKIVMLLTLHASCIDVTPLFVPNLRLVTTMNSSLFTRHERRRLLLHYLYWKILSKSMFSLNMLLTSSPILQYFPTGQKCLPSWARLASTAASWRITQR
jgi:hypothetical protein